MDYEVALLFGLTELKAQLIWKEKGVEKRSNAKIVYDVEPAREPEDQINGVDRGGSVGPTLEGRGN